MEVKAHEIGVTTDLEKGVVMRHFEDDDTKYVIDMRVFDALGVGIGLLNGAKEVLDAFREIVKSEKANA